MLRFLCGVVLVHFALAAPMESVIQKRGIAAKRAVLCTPGQRDQLRWCPKWIKYCNPRNRYSRYVRGKCPVTCGVCKAKPTAAPVKQVVSVCTPGKRDQLRSCPKWKKYCNPRSKYSRYVRGKCPVTCGVCKAAPTAAPVTQVGSANPSECISAHNSKRGLHRNTPGLTWDASLAQGSEAWAEKMAKENRLRHSSGSYGENLFSFGTTGNTVKTCRDAVNSWYNEIQYYNWNRPGSTKVPGKAIGHFTQVVWKNTARVGCGIAKIKKGSWNNIFIACRYSPAGNYERQYGNNVMALI